MAENTQYGKVGQPFGAGTLEAMYREHMDMGVVSDWLHPSQKEARQVMNQLLLDYNEPSARMQGLKDAGINPLTAAGGVAGSPSQMPSPSQSTNPIGDVAGAVADVAAAVNSGAAAYKAVEEAKVVGDIAQSTIHVNDAQIDKWAHDNGFTDVQADAFKIDNNTRDDRNQADLSVKIQQHENMVREADLIKSQKDYVDKQVKWYDDQIDAEVNLTNKRALESEKHAFQMQEQARTEKMENDFAEKYKYRRESPFDVAMTSLWFSGDYDKVKESEQFMYNLKYGMSAAEANAQQKAIEKHAYAIANAQETARSLNSIITDWNTPSTNMWSLLEKSFNISGNRKESNTIRSAVEAKGDPSNYEKYTTFMMGLNMTLDELDGKIESASAQNNFSEVRRLNKQKQGIENFLEDCSFSNFKKYILK